MTRPVAIRTDTARIALEQDCARPLLQSMGGTGHHLR